MCIGDGGIRDDDGAALNRRSETDAGTHASFSVTFAESVAQAGRPTVLDTGTKLGNPGWPNFKERAKTFA